MVIELSLVAKVVGFIVAWGVLYLLSLLVRFGDDTSVKSETIAAIITFVIVLACFLIFFTNTFKFVW